MLARSTEPTFSQIAAERDAGAAGEARIDAFGRARRHSRRVRMMKFILPALAAVIAIAFPVYSYMAAPAPVAVQADSNAFVDGKLVMANPHLEGFTKKDMRYSMNAVRAIQEMSHQDVIALDGIDAKLPISTDNSAAIAARHGVYDKDKNTLSLAGDVTVKTTDGMVAKLQSVYVDIGTGSVKSDAPVDIAKDGSRITSGTMLAEDGGKVLVFEKHVRVVIEASKLNKYEGNGGDANAAE
jgi:lipopolysaccharide export system protein LptC